MIFTSLLFFVVVAVVFVFTSIWFNLGYTLCTHIVLSHGMDGSMHQCCLHLPSECCSRKWLIPAVFSNLVSRFGVVFRCCSSSALTLASCLLNIFFRQFSVNSRRLCHIQSLKFTPLWCLVWTSTCHLDHVYMCKCIELLPWDRLVRYLC